MASNNQFLSVSELDVLQYKENLKTFLKGQAIFQDYNFEGSNLSTLIDLLAYNTFNSMFYLNQIGSEMFLDSATLAESVVSHAKELNYVPRSRVSAMATVNITISPGNNAPATITIPKGFYITATSDSKTYLFSTDQAYVVRNDGGVYASGPINVYEGRIVTEYFTVNGTQRYIIASSNVDVSSISVTVQNSSLDTSNSQFEYADNLYGVGPTDKVFFVQGYGSSQYEVVFGNDNTGQGVNNGNIVIIKYRDCSGSDGNYLSRFTAVGGVIDITGVNYNTVSVTTVEQAIGGAERETVDSIKFNAPRHFASQSRAITTDDYVTLIKTKFPSIQSIAIFGGETLEEKQYGRVAIATKPYGALITPDNIKASILQFLKDKTSVSINPIFLDPDYFNVRIDTIVYYDPTATNNSESDIESAVRTAITTYATNDLADFNSDFRFSRLTSAIDDSDEAIVSNDSTVWMVKRVSPDYNVETDYTIKYNNEFYQELVASERPLGQEPTVFTDYFFHLHSDGVTYFARIIDNGLGILHLVNGTNDSTILSTNVGTVDYDTGKVNITIYTNNTNTDHINVYAKLAKKDILVGAPQIIDIEQDDVNVTILSI